MIKDIHRKVLSFEERKMLIREISQLTTLEVEVVARRLNDFFEPTLPNYLELFPFFTKKLKP